MHSLEEMFYSTSWPLNYSTTLFDNSTYNNTNGTEAPSGGNQFILPWWRQMIWTVLFAGMIVVATGGNLIVIWIVLAHKRMRTVTNYFLVNLSIADAMVSTLNVIFNYTYMLNSHWPFGNLYCKISQFIAVLTICASVFTLMAISIDRFPVILSFYMPCVQGIKLWGGLVSGNDNGGESLHRPFNDNVFDLNDNSAGNRNMNRKDSVTEKSESQFVTVASTSIINEQSLQRSAFDEKGSDLITNDNYTPVTNRMDNFESVPTRQFSDDTDDNVSGYTIKSTEKYDETTYSTPAMPRSLNTNDNQRNQTNSDTAPKTSSPIPNEKETTIYDSSGAPPSPSQPQFSDEFGFEAGKSNSNIGSTIEPIATEPLPNLEQSRKGKPVISTDDKPNYEKLFKSQNSEVNKAVLSDSILPEAVSAKPVHAEAAQEKEGVNNDSSRDQSSSTLNESYGNYKIKPIDDEVKEKESSKGSGTDKPENWLSVLQSMVPSREERLDFNEKMLQSIQNTVSNSNVNHNVMNNAPAVPCSHTVTPSSSNSYPSSHWPQSSDSMPVLPAGVPFEVEIPEEYSDPGIDSQYPYYENTNADKRDLHNPDDQLFNPLGGWSVEPIGTHINPVIHIEGDIMIQGLSQPMRLTRRCRRILMRPEPICKRGKPICRALCNGCKPVCRPGRVICKEHPSQRLRVKLVCKRIWERERLPSQRLMYSAPSYVSPDYEIIDDQIDLVNEPLNDWSISEANDCDHELSETPSTPLILEGVSDVDDAVPDEEEDTGVSEEVFEEAIRKAINEAPEILAPEPNEGLEFKAVQTPRPELLLLTEKPQTEVSKPSPSLVERRKPFPIVNQNTGANNKLDKLPVTQSEVPLKPAIERETVPNSKAKTTNNFANDNINRNVNTNVNSNTNLNLNNNNGALKPVLPVVQMPVILPVASPVIPAQLSKNNENLNANSNVNMNLNVNQNHNGNVNDNVRLPTQPTVQPRLNESTETKPQADPAMPTFEYNTPSQSGQNIKAVNQNVNMNVNSNTNINQQHNINDQIEIPHQEKIESPLVKMIPQVVEPIVLQPSTGAMYEPLSKNLQQNVNTNVNSNVNINQNNNVNDNAREAMTPNIKGTKGVSIDENPIVLPNVVLPSINQGNENANVNANLNVNSNINKNANQNVEPAIQKADEKGQISIPEPIQVAEAPVEVVAPIYEVPLLPALSSTSLNVNSNVNQNVNNNVNSNGVDNTIKSTEQQQQQQQQLPKEPINQSMALTNPPKPTSEPILVQNVSDSVNDAPKVSDQNANENSNRNVSVNSNQNNNHGTMNKTAQFPAEIIPIVVPQSVLTPISANVPTLHGNSNRDANINHNVNSNMNINSNGNAAVNAAELPNHDVPVLVREPRPVAVLSEPSTREVMPVAPVPSQVSQDRNVNSNTNFNFNSNVNNNANQMIAVPPEQPDPPIIKPVESQPVVAPNNLEIPPLNVAQSDLRQDVNANTNVNKNVNVNSNVNTNHKMNSNENYDTREIPQAAKEAVLISAITEPTVTHNIGNNDVRREPKGEEIPRVDELTALNKNHNIDVNVNRNSNVNVNQNLNSNQNNNIKNRGQSLLAVPAPAVVLSQEPILLPPQGKVPVSPLGTILGPQVLQNAETNANYATNANFNHNFNSNANFNQHHRIKGQEPILPPPLTPSAWIQVPVLQHEIVPNTGSYVDGNSNVNLNKNSNANINQNVNLNQNHNIVSREPSGLPTGREYFNNNNYAPILQPDVREPVMIAAPTPLIEEKKKTVPQGTRNSQINANQNANLNMNYNSNYNHNANYNSGANINENGYGKVPSTNPHLNILPPVIMPQSPNRGTGLWNSQKNSNINSNYNSNMNFNSNVNANSNYNSNIGQSGLGTVPSGLSGTREANPEKQNPLFIGNPAIDTPTFSDIQGGTPTQTGYNVQQNIDSNANYNSNLNYNSNYNANFNHNANYNAQLREEQKTPKRKGWYELWYNNGDDKDGWTEIWNNKQFKRFLEQQLKDMKQQEDIQAQAQAQAFAVTR